MSEGAWISLGGLVLSIIVFFIGRFSASKSEGEKTGSLASDIGYIKAGIDELKNEIKSIRSEMNEFSAKLARLEESIKSAHRRIDEIISKE